ncbi:MAG: iron-sulfur cluster repair di-iron protein [Bacteroidetes bacterium]|nr:iron-sulfur cluster repair di-iron protein [Bacteroidota bacterium]MCB0841982.1 iron-sulfur cluster repair di-iron protein [Bacteroidota bacterium]
MKISKANTIGEIVAQNYRAASVFNSYKIDFCCKGNRNLEEVCNQKNIPLPKIQEELQNAIQSDDPNQPDYNQWPIDLVIDIIEKKHHRYVTNKIPEISAYLKKICAVHGDNHPELIEIKHLFDQSAGALSMHMKKEELILFPFARKLVKMKAGESNAMESAPFGSVNNPINMMLHEHDTEGERFRQIAALTNEYSPPAGACTTYRVTFSMLKEFEEDLHLHIHLENNIVFPKVAELEKELGHA